LTSNQDQNDHRPIVHMSSDNFRQPKCFVFVTFVCNYTGESYVAARHLDVHLLRYIGGR